MNNVTFIVDYICYDINNNIIKDGKIKIKNRKTAFEAKCGLEDFLKKKHSNFNKLIINKCEPEFNEIFESFNNIFGKDNNPFSFF